MTLRRAMVLGVVVGAATACGEGSTGAPPDAATDPLVEHQVAPTTTDGAIKAPNRMHYAYVDRSATSNGLLFVFLPGTGQEPSQTKLLLQLAAHAGYHAIGVDYPNSDALADLCVDQLDCYGNARQEILEGNDVSPVVTVDAASSITNRTVKLLAYLATTYASEGWGGFSVNGAVDWSKVAVAGHSQGGGHAAFIAKLHAVARVVMFSSVVDASSAQPPVPATWVSSGHLTPSEKYFGLRHTGDPLAPRIEANLVALGVSGAASIDGASAPFGGAHGLTTAAPSINPHNSVVVDGVTPKNDAGDPTLKAAWTYLIGP